jgi:DamX protein
MKNYVEELGLRFDPFEPSVSKQYFYGGGDRQDLCNQIVESAMYGENIIAAYGCLGSGKSMLAAEIAKSFADEAVSVLVLATLFMNSEQFVEIVADQLNLPTTDFSKDKIIQELSELANQLDLEAKSLLIQIDDAHELSREVLHDLLKIKSISPPNSVHIVLFGENQLASMLQSVLTAEQGAGLIEFELPSFASDATIDYVRFKLERAGYSKPLPMSGAALGSIHNASNGIPGAINALASDILEREYQAIDGGASLDDFDLDEGPANRRSDSEQQSNAARSPAFVYMIAASVLVVVFVAAIVFIRPESQTGGSETSIPVATASAPIVRTAAESEPARAIQPVAAPAIASPVSTPLAAEPNQSSPATGQVIRQPAAATAATNAASVDEAPAKTAQTEPVPMARNTSAATAPPPKPNQAANPAAAAPVKPPAIKAAPAGLSGFEQKIMRSPSSNYIVQILGASSETNIQKYLEKESTDLETGYFETMLNGKPWFVVLVGNFPDRAAATAAMNTLPDSAKAYGPWVRPVAEIQTAITAMQRSN